AVIADLRQQHGGQPVDQRIPPDNQRAPAALEKLALAPPVANLENEILHVVQESAELERVTRHTKRMTCGAARRQITEVSIFSYARYSCAGERLTARGRMIPAAMPIPMHANSRTANSERGARPSVAAVVCACLAGTLWMSSANASPTPTPTPTPSPAPRT